MSEFESNWLHGNEFFQSKKFKFKKKFAKLAVKLYYHLVYKFHGFVSEIRVLIGYVKYLIIFVNVILISETPNGVW